jgi:2-keto-3-deoxy-L-fuconate dehydrogenase
MGQLDGLRALVTGGASGIGAATAAALAAEGAAVTVLDVAAEVAHAVVYLASPAAGSTTGAELAVDGGLAGVRPRPRA